MSYFNFTKIIEKKRKGEILKKDDIQYFVDCVVKSTQPNADSADATDRAQIGAMLMAIYLNGLNCDETAMLTQSMTNSGYIFSWPSEWKHLVVDKHSTGGVGDKVSLVLAPALAALGLKVPMISGRSLAHTGGTLDKLESIPGFRVLLTKEEIYNVIESTGCCIVGQTDDYAPADKVLYQCREITATITCPPLIIASIVSKKLCEGISAMVYDVKYGKGSVFKSKEEAIDTARELVKASTGVKASAVLTSMENPLGKTVGNSVEVLEAIECLKGGGPSDLLQVICALGCEILRLVHNKTDAEGKDMMMSVLSNGQAMSKFHDMLIHQGVKEQIAKEICYGDASSVLPRAMYQKNITYNGKEGFINEIDPLILAKVWKEEACQSGCHPGVGLTLLKGIGEKIQTGDAWLTVHHNNKLTDETVEELAKAILVSSRKTGRTMTDRKIYFSSLSALNEEKL